MENFSVGFWSVDSRILVENRGDFVVGKFDKKPLEKLENI